MGRKPHIANAIKDMGAGKAKTRAIADHAKPRSERTPVAKAVTGPGGARRKGPGEGRTPHPSQRGGVKPDAAGEERRGNTARERRSGEKAPGAGLIKGSSRSRLETPAAVGGRTRTGRDPGGSKTRAYARDLSRARGCG